uniref:Uncharacterized protein n=1 Tax=Strombidium rassoulzadegani TaxID=1082188 RepID=A0A7S3CJF6_9SPIT|mmetsp:Transcript_12732/g.21466  ORF Transcript_12732/g.21466 Transcript_12732/m.21466 type:complete len:139 (+) Transcript_12732:99-515(+)|eukprot:CAMPEP_0168613024 /NCGR_PEP_ID=MMETSP0449_2-20121227/3228_1 /TAXON_ID=1082188 /ORGANISM="Strombidium rassoulzadegani, Strain ras09" /LENGTH=138 /DNA_ID=CAMNT_0008653625 /DNA_START=66 /DNA_END=482 /DNA_ORIENTATION=+
MNNRPIDTRKPNSAFYRKGINEGEPTWKDKRDLVTFLIEESLIQELNKTYLRECQEWIPRYQYRGFKYGLISSSLTYLFFPVVRRQPFVKRFAISMLPMFYFLKWGYTWGHENFWRRAKEVVVTYEIYAGTRSKFTMK